MEGLQITVAVFSFTVLVPMLIFNSHSAGSKFIWSLLLLFTLYVWSLILARSAAATILLATLCYHIFLARRTRVGLFLTTLPILIGVIYFSATYALQVLSTLDPSSDGHRYKTIKYAWEYFSRYPLLGFGQQSEFSIPYTQIIHPKFYPSDVGLVGIIFKFGIVGLTLYLFFTFYSIYSLAKANWEYRKAFGRSNILLVTLIIMFLQFSIQMAISPKLDQVSGISLTAVGLALSFVWRHHLKHNSSRNALR